MFDFDNFINKSCHLFFGLPVIYRPKKQEISSFDISGDFHEAYVEVNLKTMETADISTARIVLFVRDIDFPASHPKPIAGDFVVINDKQYQIVNIEPHIPGSQKLILHEDF